ncbi:MAG: hypothetical protein EOO61_17240 [Hymenobacter sp.]|nr:MAG: hypothetical protein EOO61_17240 [Hymenobacter sp.]
MDQKWKWAIVALVLITIIVVIVLAIVGVFSQGKTTAEKLGPDAPSNQVVAIAKRTDNSKYQVLLSTFTKTAGSGSFTWDQVYYVMYNPATSSDPSQTTFSSFDDAYAYYKSGYVASPLNKSYSPVSTTLLNGDYSNIRGPL